MSLSQRCYNNNTTMGMYLWNGWTWHMISPTFTTFLVNTSNLFESLCIDLSFFLLSLFLQLWVTCSKPLQPKYFLFCITLSQFILFLNSLFFCHLHFLPPPLLFFLPSSIIFSSQLLSFLFPLLFLSIFFLQHNQLFL